MGTSYTMASNIAMRVELLIVNEKIAQMKQDQLDALKEQGHKWLEGAGENEKLQTQILNSIRDIKQGIDKAYAAILLTIQEEAKILGGADPKDYKIVHVFRTNATDKNAAKVK